MTGLWRASAIAIAAPGLVIVLAVAAGGAPRATAMRSAVPCSGGPLFAVPLSCTARPRTASAPATAPPAPSGAPVTAGPADPGSAAPGTDVGLGVDPSGGEGTSRATPTLFGPAAARSGGSPIPNPVDGLNAAVSGIVGGVAKRSTNVALDGLSSWVASGTSSLLRSVVTALDHATAPDLGAAWFDGQYATMVSIAFLLAAPLIFASLITAVVRQDAGSVLRTVLVHLPVAAVGTTVAIDLVNLALAATDALCARVTQGTPGGVTAMFIQLRQLLDRGVPGVGGFGVVVVCVLIAVGAFMLTLELIVRSAAVYVAMLFLPIALAGLIWPATARWGRRLAETLAVLILSKFVIVAVISMAVAALHSGLAGDGLSGLLTGAALLMLAVAAPFSLMRMVPVVEAGMVGHLEGMGRQLLASAPSPRTTSPPDVLRGQGGGPQGAPDGSGDGLAGAATTRVRNADGTQSGDAPVPSRGQTSGTSSPGSAREGASGAAGELSGGAAEAGAGGDLASAGSATAGGGGGAMAGGGAAGAAGGATAAGEAAGATAATAGGGLVAGVVIAPVAAVGGAVAVTRAAGHRVEQDAGSVAQLTEGE